MKVIVRDWNLKDPKTANISGKAAYVTVERAEMEPAVVIASGEKSKMIEFASRLVKLIGEYAEEPQLEYTL